MSDRRRYDRHGVEEEYEYDPRIDGAEFSDDEEGDDIPRPPRNYYEDSSSEEEEEDNSVPSLSSFLRLQDWNSFLVYLESHENEAAVADSFGQFPLHVACDFGAPLIVTEKLLQAHPDAAAIIDECGCLPLHLLFVNSHEKIPSFEVVKLILDANPAASHTSDNEGMHPLHRACIDGAPTEVLELLLSANPEAPFIADNDGHLPFHKACICPNMNVINSIFAANPEAARIADKEGCFPLHLLFKFWIVDLSEILDFVLNAYPEALLAPDNRGCLPLHYACIMSNKDIEEEVDSYSDPVVDLLSIDLPAIMLALGRTDNFGELPLHYACENGCVTGKAIKALLKTYPEAASIADNDGLLPLHYACREWGEDHREAFMALLDQNIDATRVLDRMGRSPLHFIGSESSVPVEVVERIVLSYPEALHLEDNEGRQPDSNKWMLNIIQHKNNFLEQNKLAMQELNVGFAAAMANLKIVESENGMGDARSLIQSLKLENGILKKKLEGMESAIREKATNISNSADELLRLVK